ncbi:type I 3-dehydroquinate dehydratase [Bacillus sp. EB600]|uniref:type I 3-dehydroquinate dehydratase n=1 Tax=Bacillus sp. EB600 TaxID=2806345 RepID=UPI0035C24572
MVKPVIINGVTIGDSIPKVCVPMVGETVSALIEEAAFLNTIDLDVVEWRVDFFEDLEKVDAVKAALTKIRTILREKPLIFTLRSAKEGGNKQVSEEYYLELNKAVTETGLVDIIDVELFSNENDIKTLIETAHANNTFVIISNHDFAKTPPKDEIVSRLCKEQDLGGDILKIAVMPIHSADVLTLLDATNTMKERFAERPMITMAMGGKGVISRLAGEVFGSALTFGAAKKASAPGQIAAAELRSILTVLHENL